SPSTRRANEQQYQLAPVHYSMTSVARARIAGRISIPIARAVCWLMTKSNWVGEAQLRMPDSSTTIIRSHGGSIRCVRGQEQKRPQDTNIAYCIYHHAHGDYTYSENWVEHLVAEIADEGKWVAIEAYKI